MLSQELFATEQLKSHLFSDTWNYSTNTASSSLTVDKLSRIHLCCFKIDVLVLIEDF